MKTSLKWLGNYVDLPWGADELAEQLTLAGLEVEAVARVGNIPATVVVAEILSRESHPDADKLSVCHVSAGGEETLQIVCGAPNCDTGKRVPLATIGTELGAGFKIGKAKLRGVESHGMLCSARELGLPGGHEGLLELPVDTPLGKPLADLYEADAVIDWEITPNRPDWASHFGIAREIAAVADRCDSLRLPAVRLDEPGGMDVSELAAVDVMDTDLCPRYTARVIRNVTIGPSPEWMQQALMTVGLRPINNVVDITNYVMLEIGQPLHAFDYDKLAGQRIVVRRATDGETLITLDGTECKLSTDNLLIADGDRGVALAGVMGGSNSEISETTTTVLLESAAFDPSNIRRTARTHGFHTDSSYRFERGIDIERVDWASRRACALICEYAGGRMVDGVIDAYSRRYRAHQVPCRVARTNQLLGTELASREMCSLLGRLGLDVVAEDPTKITVSVPSFRLDLWREADLIEEVARLHGLNNLPAVETAAVVGGPRAADSYYPIEQVRDELLALGLSEAINYSLLGVDDSTAGTGVPESELVKIRNPISAENSVMRPSVMPGLLKTVAHNIAHQVPDLAMFEIGRAIVNRPGTPEERTQIGIVITGRRNPERFGDEREALWDFYDLKGILEGWFGARGMELRTKACEHPGFRPGRCALIKVGELELAVLGEVDGRLTRGMRLGAPLYMAVVEFEALTAAGEKSSTFTPLPQFPSTTRDISLVAPTTVSNADIIGAIHRLDPPLLEKVELFDVYEDPAALGKNKRSLAYSLTYRDTRRTLTDGKANAVHDRLKRDLAKELPIQYR